MIGITEEVWDGLTIAERTYLTKCELEYLDIEDETVDKAISVLKEHLNMNTYTFTTEEMDIIAEATTIMEENME